MPENQPASFPEASLHLSEFLSYLCSGPELNELCNTIVFKWKASDRIAIACVGEIGQDGSFTFSGSFKYEAEKSQFNSATTIWEDHPSAVAVREQKALVLVDRGEIEERFPKLSAAMPNLSSLLATPLMTHSSPHGVLVVCSDKPLADPEEALAELTGYSLALSLYVHNPRDHRQNPSASSPVTSPLESPQRRTPVPHQLSQRQLTVLDLLPQGYSNRGIGRLIGFSESTVRQDTMAIYSFLGVSGRKEAVEVAILRNMLEIMPDEAPPAF
jgi:DNA-binding NarL/FixJ family response regulator